MPEPEVIFPPRMDIPAEELDASFQTPAPFINRMYLTNSGGIGFRLSFAEQRAEATLPIPRAAVFMTVADAIALRDLLAEQLKDAVQVPPANPNAPAQSK